MERRSNPPLHISFPTLKPRNILPLALRSLEFGEEDWDEWPQEFLLKLIDRSKCKIEVFETPAKAEEDLLSLMRAMPRLQEFNAFTKQIISQSTLDTIALENLAPEVHDGQKKAKVSK